MTKMLLFFGFMALGLAAGAAFGQAHEEDIIATSRGDLRITFIGHASLMLGFEGQIIHVDGGASSVGGDLLSHERMWEHHAEAMVMGQDTEMIQVPPEG